MNENILGNGFNTDDVPASMYDPIPAGDYKLVVTKTEQKKTAAGNGMYLRVEFTIHGGQFNGRKLWSRSHLVNENQTTVNIAKAELKQLCLAVNKKQIKDAVELMDLALIGRVIQKPNNQTGEIQNEIKKYISVNSGGNVTTSSGTQPVATTTAGKPAAPWAR